MKNANWITSLLLCLTTLFTIVSCSPDDPADTSQTVIENNVQSGDWKITSFIDSGNDETHHFNGYSFTFGSNGVLTAENGSIAYTGTWNITDSNSNDDSPDDLDFNILFNLSNEFEDLNEDWHFVTQSSNRIELIHISGGNGGTDTLVFERS